MTPINARTQLTGLIGWPVSHSFSPAMHNAALAVLGLNWVYVPLPVPPDRVGDAVRGLPALGFQGVNVTVPHKQAVMPFLDEISPAAQAIGAVNTILVEQESGRLLGFNTDWRGFLADLVAKEVEVNGRHCLVLGAGGSARGIVYALFQAGGRVLLLARRPEQAYQLAADLGNGFVEEIRPFAELESTAAQTKAPLIINTTPLGMSPHVNGSPWPDDVPVPAGSFVYDLVYNPPETRLMRQALDAGCHACNGLGMLLRQGAISFALWTGSDPDLSVMQEALEAAGA
ncbi:MAG: shikimate dehydrogenase [Candidatus Promineifilaceae bacterium]